MLKKRDLFSPKAIKKYLVIFILFSYIYASSQSSMQGEVTLNMLKLDQQALNNDYDAIVLYDIGETRFVEKDDALVLQHDRKTRIKILTQEGTKWANFNIWLHGDKEKESLERIKACSYTLTGNGVVKKEIDPTTDIYTQENHKGYINNRVAIPNAQAGSIIDYEYQILTNRKTDFVDWEFQKEIPVMYSEYTAHICPYYDYVLTTQQISHFDFDTAYTDNSDRHRFREFEYYNKVYKWALKHVPPFEGVEFLANKDDYISKIDFQLSKHTNPYDGFSNEILTTWHKLVKELEKDNRFGKFYNQKSKVKKIYKQLQIETLPKHQKIKKIIRFVKDHYEWNKRNRLFTGQKLKDFLMSTSGNCAEINLFLCALLSVADIEAYPVIISTRDHGKIGMNYPFYHYFNYVIVLVKAGNSNLLVDATEPLTPYFMLPKRCLNDFGLCINKNEEPQWFPLKESLNNIYKTDIIMEYDSAEDMIACKAVYTFQGYNALKYRNKIDEEGKEEFQKSFFKSNYYENVTGFEILNMENLELPLKIKAQFNYDPGSFDNKIIISPFLDKALDENPLKFEQRKYPIDFIYTNNLHKNILIKIPQGYQVDNNPGNSEFALKDQSAIFKYNTRKAGEFLQINSNIKFLKAKYKASVYRELKDFFNHIQEMENEKIVFEKTTEQD